MVEKFDSDLVSGGWNVEEEMVLPRIEEQQPLLPLGSKAKLHPDFNLGNTKGLIVSWYPQLEVLAHDAVGCFATHRGWNSTLEEFSLGVSMVAIPQWTDQETNAKNTEGVWKMGVRCVRSEDEILRRGAVEKCLREVMDGEQGKEIILYSREHYASSSKGGKRISHVS
ncbi:UDP-glycosyltransferase 74E2 [Linum perenne]